MILLPTILIDTREKKPYDFSPGITIERRALPAGDYSIAGAEHQFAIERKSLADWLHTIMHDKKRFAAELSKLAKYDRAHIIVEANWPDVLDGKYERSATMKPASVKAMTLAISQQYGIPVHMAGDRVAACEIVECLCLHYARMHMTEDAQEMNHAETGHA